MMGLGMLLNYWVGPREEASYVSFWNQTVVVLVDDLDNASCERAFVVVMWGCGLRVEKGLMIMKWPTVRSVLFRLLLFVWIGLWTLDLHWILALSCIWTLIFCLFFFLFFLPMLLFSFFFFCTCLFLRTVWSKGLGRCGWWKKDRLNDSVYGSKGCKGFWYDEGKWREEVILWSYERRPLLAMSIELWGRLLIWFH